jgi:hypothetical protein
MLPILLMLATQIFYSILFAICESLFHYIIDGYLYTTLDQLILSFCLSPFIIQIDRMLSLHKCNPIITLLIRPILFWIFEIVGGFTLIYYFGKNNAWTYETPDALFFGMIRLYYYPLFLFLGLLFHYIDVTLFR